MRRGRTMRFSVETIEMKGNWMRGALALFTVATVAACGGDAQADGTGGGDDAASFVRIINVEVQEIQPETFVEDIRLTAAARANQDVQVSAQESGVVREILAEKGTRVRAGNVPGVLRGFGRESDLPV